MVRGRPIRKDSTECTTVELVESLWNIVESLWNAFGNAVELLENNSSMAYLPKEWNSQSYATYLELIPVERPLN